MRSQRSGVLTMRRRDETFSSSARHYAIGGDHEVFDQFGGVVLLLIHQVNDLLIEHDRAHFAGFDVQCALPVALIPQRLRGFILQFELRLQSS